MAIIREKDNSLVVDYHAAKDELKRLVRKPLMYIGAGLGTGAMAVLLLSRIQPQFIVLLFLVPAVLIMFGVYRYSDVMNKNEHLVRKSSDIVLSGIQGELNTLHILRALPDTFTIIPDILIKNNDNTAQLDFLLIGENGIWIVENKNQNGTIRGDSEEKDWIQEKVGRDGTPYSKSFYSPVKQVSTHVFKLKQYLKDKGIAQVPWIEGVVFFSNEEVILDIDNSKNKTIIQGHSALIQYFEQQSQNKSQRNIDSSQIKEMLWNIS